MSDNHVSPALRFVGFTEDWKQRKLFEITSVAPYKPYLKEVEDGGEYEVIQQGDNPVLGYAHGEPFFDFKKATLFGDHTLSLYKPKSPFFVATDGLKILYSDEMEGDFYYYLLETYKPDSEGYKRHFSILKESECCFPENIGEQQRIGEFFNGFDIAIALHQRQYDRLLHAKEAMLLKMFPRSNQDMPELRFSGFTSPWRRCKLGELVQFSKGSGYSKSDLKKTGTPIILYGRLYTQYETVITDVDTFADEKPGSVYSRGGEVIVPASGETAEDISIASVVEQTGVLLGGDLNIITPPDDIDSAFLAISISNGKPHADMARMAQGKSVVHLHNADLEKIDLVYPDYDEQTQISDFFRQLDDTIALYRNRLTVLGNLKKAMLQKMFPAVGRN